MTVTIGFRKSLFSIPPKFSHPSWECSGKKLPALKIPNVTIKALGVQSSHILHFSEFYQGHICCIFVWSLVPQNISWWQQQNSSLLLELPILDFVFVCVGCSAKIRLEIHEKYIDNQWLSHQNWYGLILNGVPIIFIFYFISNTHARLALIHPVTHFQPLPRKFYQLFKVTFSLKL